MKITLRTLALASLGLFLAPAVQAQSVGTLTCQAAGAPTLTTPVFAYLLDVDTQDAIDLYDVSVYADISMLGPLLAAQNAQTSYSTCTLSNGSTVSISNAVISDVMASAVTPGAQTGSAQVYASATFFFSTVTVGGVTVATKGPGSAEARAKTLAIIKARNLANIMPKNAGAQ